MKAKEIKLLDFLSSSKQFVIPIYQRPYRWEAPQCRKLWEDVLRAGTSEEGQAHFVGLVVYIQDGLYSVAHQPALLLIDGQQRMTTFLLIIEAIARAQETRDVSGDFTPKKLRQYYLKDSFEDGERAYKMLLSATDRGTLKAVIDSKELPQDHSIRIAENFALFRDMLKSADIESVCRGLSKILVVDISLEFGHDNPQLIFESLNSTGKELGQADLIRNYVLMGLEPAIQTELYEDHWRPMELEFGQVAYASHFDSFMRHFLTLKTGDIPNVEDVYDAFKAYAVEQGFTGSKIAPLVADIHRHASCYCRIALGNEPDKPLNKAFHDIRELKAEVTYPFLLELYSDFENGKVSHADFLAALRFIESYIFRRIVCGIPTNSHNKTFSTFGRMLRKKHYLSSIEAHFLTLPSYRRFPDDREFQQELARRDLYNFRNRSFWLRRLENHNRKELVAVEEYTIEHIMPQNENLSDGWKADLGPAWEQVRDTYLHTIGNLTLTAYNPSLSDKPFAVKRDLPESGLGTSPLRLNDGLKGIGAWNEAAIQDRAARLCNFAVQVWPAPTLPVGDVQSLKQKKGADTAASIADHPAIATGQMKSVFMALRSEVMDLNPAILEAFTKLYVTFSTEEVFLSVIPQQAKLRLLLNIPFPELQDTRGLARDMTNIGHWAKGHAELPVASSSDLAYVMGLVRQAFEWQMDGDGSD